MLAFPPDFTFLIQLASFFVLLLVLNRLLFQPFGEVLAERQRRTAGAASSAEDDRSEADELKATFENALAEARLEASSQAEALRRETRDGEVEIFNQAKAAATARLEQLRGEIDNERQQAETQLRGSAEELARQMVRAVLGEAAGS